MEVPLGTRRITDELTMSNRDPRGRVGHDIERLGNYASGAAMIFENAEALHDEGRLLGTKGHFARATVLHQISMEECSKIDILGATATLILAGHDVDDSRLAKEFRDHKAKNYVNAFFARTTKEELSARARRDWRASSDAFKRVQERFHDEVNAIKNAGLYVDFRGGRFSAPVDEIDRSTAMAFQCVNAYFLQRCDNYVRLLRKLVSEPDFFAQLIKDFVERSEGLSASRDSDPQQILDLLMEELRANYASRVAELKLDGLP